MPRDESPRDQESRRSGRLARNRIRIAWMYYVEGLTQNEIAEKLDIGRVTVVRNINEALKQREVKIWIEGDIAECLDLEKQLRQTFGLEEAVVVPEPSNPANIARSIGVATGMYITDHLHSDMSIGVGWGTTLHDALQTLTPKDVENLKVVSMMGGILQARHYNPSEFAWQFARITDADCYLLPAPALVDSPATRSALIERCGLSDVFKRAERLDMAVMSIGYIAAGSSTFKVNLVSEAERAELLRAGAVGDVLCHFYDREGKLVDHSVNERVMSIPVPTLRKVPRRVIASGGAEKVEALLGAMKLIDCNVLITTEATAQELLIRKK